MGWKQVDYIGYKRGKTMETNTYFESGTNVFSSFCDIRDNGNYRNTNSQCDTDPHSGITITATPPAKAPAIQNWIMFVIIAAAYFCIIKKEVT